MFHPAHSVRLLGFSCGFGLDPQGVYTLP